MSDIFPDRYEKPILLDVYTAAAAGWSAACSTGGTPNQTPIQCSRGDSVLKSSDTLINPEIIGEGL
ncbi:hypothetical protein GX411_06020 [Candidatus Fermentibacteria bacterium]|nr:hypothetical protein [Candidatus Fermentibacteria bacterium]